MTRLNSMYSDHEVWSSGLYIKCHFDIWENKFPYSPNWDLFNLVYLYTFMAFTNVTQK